MIRRTLTLLAGGAPAGRAAAGRRPGPGAGQEDRARHPRHSADLFGDHRLCRARRQGFFKKHGVDVEIRPFDNGTAAARAVVAGDADFAWSPTPPVDQSDSNADVPLVAIYGMPNPGLGASAPPKPARPARTSSARRSASIRSAARARWRCARCSPAARREASNRYQAGRARLEHRAGHDRRPPALRRAASRRPRRDRAPGQEAQHPAGDEEHQPDQPLSDAGGAQGQSGEEPRRHRAHGRRHDRGRAFHAGSEERRRGGRGRARSPATTGRSTRPRSRSSSPSTSGRPKTTACRATSSRRPPS